MTDGNDPAVPPVSLRELAGRVETVESLIRTVAWGVARETDDLNDAVTALRARVDVLTPAPPDAEPEPEPEPQAWVDYATAQDWRELARWVDWLMATYDLQPSRAVLPCWPVHLGVVEELAALRTAWRAAAKAGRSRTPNDALIYWHDRWLHPVLHRLRQDFQIKLCEDQHKPVCAGRGTDLDLLAAVLVDVAERRAGWLPPHQ